jgi:hypothetical protein
MDILNTILKNKNLKEVSTTLNVSTGTVKRWIGKKSIPSSYKFDLMKMNGMEIDYKSFSYKDKDQFFTTPEDAKYCFGVFKNIVGDLSGYTFIEPSAGSGNFFNILPKKKIGLDIEPRCKGVKEMDYLKWKPPQGKYIVIGNPPFGLRGNLALKFINHSIFADYVAFILPQLFESDGKGVPRKRVKGFNLIHSEKLNTTFKSPDGDDIKVNCVFQIWSKHTSNKKYEIENQSTDDYSIYSLSDGDKPSMIRNKKFHNCCDIYLPSTCFGEENIKCYNSMKELPNNRGYGIVFHKNKTSYIEKCKSSNWKQVCFLSTNSAYNLRMSQINKLLK